MPTGTNLNPRRTVYDTARFTLRDWSGAFLRHCVHFQKGLEFQRVTEFDSYITKPKCMKRFRESYSLRNDRQRTSFLMTRVIKVAVCNNTLLNAEKYFRPFRIRPFRVVYSEEVKVTTFLAIVTICSLPKCCDGEMLLEIL